MSTYTGPERRQGQQPVPQDRRKPGRPRLIAGEDTTTVSVRLPESLHDHACLLALREGQDVGALIRLALQHYVFANPTKR